MNEDEENKRLFEQAIRALQSPWLRPHPPKPTYFPHFSTTFPALDEALAIGGIPRGRITEISGTPTSGMVTLALKVLAQAQKEGLTAVYLDLYEAFDPDYAGRCGLKLETLWVLRPRPLALAWSVLADVIVEGKAGAVVVDVPAETVQSPETSRVLRATLKQLARPLHQSPTALLFLTPLQPTAPYYPATYPLTDLADLSLRVQREKWLYRQQDIRGYQAQVQVVKQERGRVGHTVTIAITFNGTVQGDAT